LRGVAELCRRHDVLLICDEVATGFGRTGTMFAAEQAGVTPDLMCVAKGLTGGYLPLAATLASERVYQAFLGRFDEAKTFFHGHTYTGNPLACAVALANLELFESEQTLSRMKAVEAVLAEGLARVATLEHVGEVRRLGFMTGVELVADRATKREYDFAERLGFRVCLAARKHQVLLRPLGNVVVLMPPLSLTEAEARLLCDALFEAVKEVTG
jgi:adenosylmethionine-8-amino-7-oxononanoate aminotransferase